MNTEHATPELFAALSAAQGEIENATKNAKNPHFRSQYADLAEILNTVRPIFAKHGLTITQSPSYDGSFASVTTVIGHESGGYIYGMASCVPAKSDAQGIGSATTYLRRYSAAGMAGIAQEDDDGNSAAHDRKPNPPSEAKPKPQQSPIAAKMASFRADLIRQGQEENVAPKQDKAAMDWANGILKEQAAGLGMNLKEVDSWTQEQCDTLLKAVYEEYVLISEKAKQDADAAKGGA